MSVPKEEFEAWIESARKNLAVAMTYPLIDQKVHNFDLLADAYNQYTENDATREHLEARLAHAPADHAVRFVVLNYYYELVNFNADLKEEYVSHLRKQFRNDLAFFVRLRPVEDCTEPNDTAWEITNACAIRDWPRAQALYQRLRAGGHLPPETFHAAYGNLLFRASFDEYDKNDTEDHIEILNLWSVGIVNRKPNADLDDLNFELSMLALGLAKEYKLPAGRPDELLRDAKNELEKARDAQPDFRPGLRSALARCYMARGDHRYAANEYKILASTAVDQLAWASLASTNLRPTIWARVVTALELAHDDHELRDFLNHWIKTHPQELGPREHLAKLEARHGNYKAAFDHLAEEQAINPAHDQDWKATLLVALGTRADNNDRVAAIAEESIKKNPELWAIVQGIIEDYWPTIQRLADPAKQSFSIATRLLFDKTIGETAWIHAGFAASKAVELQLRSSVFDPYANTIRRTSTVPRRSEPEGPAGTTQRLHRTRQCKPPYDGYDGEVPAQRRESQRRARTVIARLAQNTQTEVVRCAHSWHAQYERRHRRTQKPRHARGHHTPEALRLYKTSRKWLDEISKDT
jgi:hypothetical protein